MRRATPLAEALTRDAARARGTRDVGPPDRRGGRARLRERALLLAKFGLQTDPLHYSRRDGEKTPAVFRECPMQGWTDYVRTGARGYYRCPVCTTERVAIRRRRLKKILVDEASGRCSLRGYDTYSGALQFHHVDPSQKRFGLALGGLTRALAEVRQEARKCVLLCANCHAEVEAGLVLLASPADDPG